MSSVSTEELNMLQGASIPQDEACCFSAACLMFTHTHKLLGPEPNRKSHCTSVCCQVILSITVGQNLQMKVTGKEKMQVTIILAVVTVGSMYHHICL